jgi:hypothetical protein
MWKYREQASWSYSEEDFGARLDYIAAALVAWGAVTTVQVGGQAAAAAAAGAWRPRAPSMPARRRPVGRAVRRRVCRALG